MQGAGLRKYMMHKHTLPYNEIVCEFYTNLQPAIGDQFAYSIVKSREVPFIREEILRAIHISGMPEDKPSFTDRVNEISSSS